MREVGGLKARTAPKGSSASQGSVERFHETLDGQGRALKIHVEMAYNITLSNKDSIMPWIVRHSAWLLGRYLIQSDGLTAYQRRRHSNFQQSLCVFAETILYMDPYKKDHRISSNRPTRYGDWAWEARFGSLHVVAIDECQVCEPSC